MESNNYKKVTLNPKAHSDNAKAKEEKIKSLEKEGQPIADDELDKVAGGCGVVSPIFGDVNTCELCGNNERGTVYPLQDPYSGLRIIEYYCERCRGTFGVYVG